MIIDELKDKENGNWIREVTGKYPKVTVDSNINLDEVIENANPNHDKLGKFATGGGGGIDIKAFKGKKSEQATKYISENYSGVEYTDNELRAINDYTGSMFARVNRTLRGSEATHPIKEIPTHAAKTKEAIKQLDHAMTRTKLKTDTTLYRGATSSTDLKVGQVIKDKGYGSTSIREQPAEIFLGEKMSSSNKKVKYLMTITAKKGQAGIFAQNAGNNSYENEFIIPRGSSYKITSVKEESGYFEIGAELQ